MRSTPCFGVFGYRQRVSALYDALQEETARAQSAEIIRLLVDDIVLTPKNGVLHVELRGDLAGILTIAAADFVSQVMMVAVAGLSRDQHLLSTYISKYCLEIRKPLNCSLEA
jgi:hypothetical protein